MFFLFIYLIHLECVFNKQIEKCVILEKISLTETPFTALVKQKNLAYTPLNGQKFDFIPQCPGILYIGCTQCPGILYICTQCCSEKRNYTRKIFSHFENGTIVLHATITLTLQSYFKTDQRPQPQVHKRGHHNVAVCSPTLVLELQPYGALQSRAVVPLTPSFWHHSGKHGLSAS